MKRTIKQILSLTFILILLTTCGCTGNFKPVDPPINEYPVPEDYQVAEVILDSYIAEEGFRGNFKNDGLYSMDSSILTSKFVAGQKGYVEYTVNDKIITVEATLTKPSENSTAYLVAKHSSIVDSQLKYNWPGRFYVIVNQKDNCILAPKNSVYHLDDDGNAFVCVVNEKGVLVQKEIKVAESNTKYYVVVEGLTQGEKVVLK